MVPVRRSDTVAGFMIERLGRLAQIGDTIHIDGATLQVTAMDRRRITELLLTPDSEPVADPDHAKAARSDASQ
ncbi:transporter associated domain-containing protein [Marisediminicola senii]|uniref:transporter associated domain-containing protein n=1 Tax=Marisediminicola senii TaxID=2711233 RepID=UPI0022A72988|nr:transporter associated domain-containing protein [Marisediminicola senii]